MDLRFNKILALALILPVYLTLLHTHEPEVLQHISEDVINVHSVYSSHHDHHSGDHHDNDGNKHSPQDCVVCLIVSSGDLAIDFSIDVPLEFISEADATPFDNQIPSNPLYTSYFQRRGPPASVVL